MPTPETDRRAQAPAGANPGTLPGGDVAAPRRRLALVAGAGALTVALPLHQAWRTEDRAAEALQREASGLEALGHAVEMHRALRHHGRLAERVLGGRSTLEPERRSVAGLVGAHAQALVRATRAGAWTSAEREAEDLRRGWLHLAGRVRQRLVDVAASRAVHADLVEQVLSVLDLLPRGLARMDEAGRDAALLEAAAQLAGARAEQSARRAGQGLLLLGLAGLAATALVRARARRAPQGDAARTPGGAARAGPGGAVGAPAAAPAAALLDRLRHPADGTSPAPAPTRKPELEQNRD